MKILRICVTVFLGLFFVVSNSYADNTDDTVKQLNQSWNNLTRLGCRVGEPDYYCSGVVIHTFDHLSLSMLEKPYSALGSSDHKPWMPSQDGIQKGSVSFSYLRRDIAVPNSIYIANPPNVAGYIFKPITDLALTNAPRTYNVDCAYPVNGYTDWRDLKGCGDYFTLASKTKKVDLVDSPPKSPCDASTTLIEYLKDFPGSLHDYKIFPPCSLSPDKTGFDMNINLIKRMKQTKAAELGSNEIVIDEWSAYPDSEVPLEAFFYINPSLSDRGKKSAYDAANLYYTSTGIHVPVVEIDIKKLDAGAEDPFVVPPK